MKISFELRSPIKLNKTPELETLVAAAKDATEKELKPKVKVLERVRRKMGNRLHDLAAVIAKEEHE